MLNETQGRQLLAIARAAIASNLNLPDWAQRYGADRSGAWLQQPTACFVTLMQDDQLRGCIGSLEPRRTLLDDIETNARAAAFSDPRFSLLSAEEFEKTSIEISLLSPLQPITFTDEADALAQLRPGIDGVVLECGYSRGTFLPQVWQQLPTPREFIEHLKIKAGLPATFWSDAIKLQRYTVSKFRESKTASKVHE